LTNSWLRDAEETAQLSEAVRPSTVAGLRGFATETALRKACVSVAAKALGFHNLQKLHATFMAMDANGDGVLSLAEFVAALKHEVPDESELRELFEAIDTNKSGAIDYNEFLAAALTRKRDLQKEVAREAFRFIDKDDSGLIEKEELEEFVRNFGLTEYFEEDAIEDVIDRMSGDGRVCLDQFEAWLTARVSEELAEVRRRSTGRRSIETDTVAAEKVNGQGNTVLGLPIRSRH
jgi:calcium-dependent protein kinase